MKHLKSLREFIEALNAIGEVQPISLEVDWNLEIGAIARRSDELRAPAPLFNVIKGTEPGFWVPPARKMSCLGRMSTSCVFRRHSSTAPTADDTSKPSA